MFSEVPPLVPPGFFGVAKLLIYLAPQVGLEPTTLRLTAECSAIELLRSVRREEASNAPSVITNPVRRVKARSLSGLDGHEVALPDPEGDIDQPDESGDLDQRPDNPNECFAGIEAEDGDRDSNRKLEVVSRCCK